MDKALEYAIEKNDASTVEAIVETMLGEERCEKIVYKELCRVCKDSDVSLDMIKALTKHIAFNSLVRPLIYVIRKNRFDLVQHLVCEEYADVNGNYKGSSPLHKAAFYGNSEICKFLIDEGADVDMIPYRTSALYIAVSRGEYNTVNLLIEEGADVNLATNWPSKKTPLIRAVENGDFDTIKLLLEASADVEAKDGDGKTAFDYAKESKSITDLLNRYKPEPPLKVSITIEGPKDKVDAIQKKLLEYL